MLNSDACRIRAVSLRIGQGASCSKRSTMATSTRAVISGGRADPRRARSHSLTASVAATSGYTRTRQQAHVYPISLLQLDRRLEGKRFLDWKSACHVTQTTDQALAFANYAPWPLRIAARIAPCTMRSGGRCGCFSGRFLPEPGGARAAFFFAVGRLLGRATTHSGRACLTGCRHYSLIDTLTQLPLRLRS
jgi:hypothetical protein